MPSGKRETAVLLVVTAVVALLPFLRGLAMGQSLYFRDLSGAAFPMRNLVLDGLRQGEIRFWNPYVHEGEPLSLPPLGYPLDLLQLLFEGEWGLSLVLALHIPLAAATFAALLRQTGRSRLAAGAGGLTYAWGGFALSTVNLYFYAQALAWAPLVVLGLIRVLGGCRRAVAWTAVACAAAISTTGVEIVIQAVMIGVVLGWPTERRVRRLAGVALTLALAAALVAPIIAQMLSLSATSERAGGLHASVVVSQHVHPFSFLQVLIGSLYGNLANPANEWWGSRFFDQGFPYILSLYEGAAAMALAAAGLAYLSGVRRLGVAVLGAAAVWVCLGPYGGLDHVVALSPVLRTFRFPVKAFFTLHLLVALALAAGLDALARRAPRAWGSVLAGSGCLGLLLVSLPWLPLLLPQASAWFVAHFFPARYGLPLRVSLLSAILADARVGGLVALTLALVAGLVLARRLAAARGAALVGALVVGDLLRAGAGLNPMVTPSFYRLSGEAATLAGRLRARDARVFTCDLESVPAYFRARSERPRSHDTWTFLVLKETLTPYFNVSAGVRSGLSPDKTMLVPVDRVLHPDDAACSAVPRIVGRLRAAGVSHVLSVTPQESPDLDLEEEIRNERLEPLRLYVYALRGALPRFEVVAGGMAEPGPAARGADVSPSDGPGARVVGVGGSAKHAPGQVLSHGERADELRVRLVAGKPAVLVVRDALAPGWRAEVNGRPAAVLRAGGRHRGVPVPAGRSEVRLFYRPPGVLLSLAGSLLALAAIVGLLVVVRLERTGPVGRSGSAGAVAGTDEQAEARHDACGGE